MTTTDLVFWVNDGILLLTAALVGWYALETRRLVRTSQGQVQVAQDQLKELEKQLSVSQEQVRTSQRQIESQSKPAIVVKESPATLDTSVLQLVNIGNGPALNVDCWLKVPGLDVDFDEKAPPNESLPYLEQRQVQDSEISNHVLASHVIHCRYQSISGARYASVSYFTNKEVINSAFYEEKPAGS